MLTVGALLMVAAGMYRTGAITLITDKLSGHPKGLLAAQAKILPPVAVGSAFLNNTPLVAMFIPVIRIQDLTPNSLSRNGRIKICTGSSDYCAVSL
jgi:Na+/H+ antiporter NhaD/arsenite permease-like protein